MVNRIKAFWTRSFRIVLSRRTMAILRSVLFCIVGRRKYFVLLRDLKEQPPAPADPMPKAKDEFVTRACTADDIEALTRLFPKALTPLRESHLQDMLASRLASGCPGLVAERAGVLAGAVWLHECALDSAVFNQFSESIGRPAWVVVNLFVSPDVQGEGIATRLILGAIAEAQLRGTRTLVALVECPNIASLKVFKKTGFRRLGIYGFHSLLGYRWHSFIRS